MARKPLALYVLQPYWRMVRSLTLGTQGVVLDAAGRVLLIRHTYRPGWHFPGGGVERNETVRTALARELEEEAGIMLDGEPVLHGLFENFRSFPNDHIALYVVRGWRQPAVPSPNSEIAEQGFFARDALPEGTIAPVKRRLTEILDGAERSESW
ncbi:MAG: NUDIX domain-containing protein [Hyphomicrobiaceae bacterium]